MLKIYIDRRGNENHICLMENDRLIEYHIEEDNKSLLGNVYRGRIENVLKGMDSAFVDIGEGKNAYLHFSDFTINKELANKDFRIEDMLKSGQEIIVQVIKDAVDTKGAKVTTNLSFSGRYLVLMPYYFGVNISRKIRDKEELARLKTIGYRLKEEAMGLIFRTASQGVEEETLEEEFNSLVKIFEGVEKQRNFLPLPKLIYRDLGILHKLVQDNLSYDNFEIIINNKDNKERLLEIGEYLNYPIKEKINYKEDFKLEYKELIQRGILEALNRKVKLSSGGYLVIDEMEALTSIDINTGRYVGNTSLQDTVVRTNLEAAREIAHQLKLRNIGGIIIVDFIDMDSEEDISKVLAELDLYFKSDKNKPSIIDITKLGLVEITRKRTGPSLRLQITKPCMTCQALGRISK